MYCILPGIVENSESHHGDYKFKTTIRQQSGRTVTLFTQCLYPLGAAVNLHCHLAAVKGARAACFRIVEL